MIFMYALILPTFAEAPDWTPQQLRNQSEYLLKYVHRTSQSAFFVRKSDGLEINLNFTKRHPSSLNTMDDIDDLKAKKVTPSQFPLADLVRVFHTKKSFEIYARTGFEDITATLRQPASQRSRNLNAPSWDFSADVEWFEGISREALARFAGQRLKISNNTRVGGFEVPGFASSDNAHKYVSLQELSHVAGFNITSNTTAKRYAFSFKGSNYVIPLASKEIKVGASWKPLPDLVMLKDSAVLIPVAAFD